jgi:hypothetical protein
MEETKEIAEMEARPVTDMVYQPKRVLEAAQEAAQALKSIVKQAGLIITIGKKEYLQFEAWQTLGRFYGLYAKAEEAEFIEIDGVKGFRAKAVVMNKDGHVVSGAVAFCMKDEKKWGTSPTFQLASMAQTRASAKALRNCLAWVSVLAGYSPTPAEEMVGEIVEVPVEHREPGQDDAPKSIDKLATDKQQKMIYAKWKSKNIPDAKVKSWLKGTYGVESTKAIQWAWVDDIVQWIEAQ